MRRETRKSAKWFVNVRHEEGAEKVGPEGEGEPGRRRGQQVECEMTRRRARQWTRGNR